MSLLRKGIFVSGGQVFGVLLRVIAGILFARCLGPDGMGKYELLRSAATIAATFFCLGINNSNIFFLNNRGIAPSLIVTNSLKIIVALGIVAAGALVCTVMSFPDYFGYVSGLVAVLLAVGVAANIGMLTLRSLLVARLAARRMVAVDLALPVVLLLGGGLLAVVNWLGPQQALVILSLGFLASFALVLYYVRRDIDFSRRFDWRLFHQVLVYGIKLTTTNLLLVLTGTLSVMLLRYLRQEQFTDVGLYTRAVAICSLARLVPIAVGPMLYAKWAASEGDVRTRQVEMAARMAAAYGLLAACIVVLLGKQILWLMYGEAFVPAHAALVFLAPAFVCMTVFGILSNFLASAGRAATTACILAGTVTMITVVTWLAVPTWGIQGAALGALLGNAFAMAAGLVVCRRLYGLKALNCLWLRRSDLAYAQRALKRQPNTDGSGRSWNA